MSSSILSCDIGGTHLTVSVVSNENKTFAILDFIEYRSKKIGNIYSAIDESLERFSTQNYHYDKIVISAAGIVTGTICKLSNLPWTIDSEELEKHYKLPVLLINDFAAISYTLPLINREDKKTLFPIIQRPQSAGLMAVTGAGTGLGVSALLPHKDHYICLESEGGHIDISPFDELTIALYSYYIKKLGTPLGVEYFVSGPGIARIFYFFMETARFSKNAAYEEIMSLNEFARTERISILSAEDPCCREVMRVFISLYARIASNMAITFAATGGMFLAGGIARKIIPLMLEDGLFAKYFLMNYHSHIQAFLEKIPVYVIRDYQISALGNAHVASLSN